MSYRIVKRSTGRFQLIAATKKMDQLVISETVKYGQLVYLHEFQSTKRNQPTGHSPNAMTLHPDQKKLSLIDNYLLCVFDYVNRKSVWQIKLADRITQYPALAWNYEGTQLAVAFTVLDAQSGLEKHNVCQLYDSEGQVVAEHITDGPAFVPHLSWSADDRQIALSDHLTLRTQSFSVDQLQPLKSVSGIPFYEFGPLRYQAAWWEVTATGWRLLVKTGNPRAEAKIVIAIPKRTGIEKMDVVWSPSGSKIVFTYRCKHSPARESDYSCAWVYDSIDDKFTAISRDPIFNFADNFVWQPDSSGLYCIARTGGVIIHVAL